MKKVAIVYDRVNKWGGAERVLLALHEIFPEAPLYTSVYDEKAAPWAKVFPKIYTSFLQKIPFARRWHEGFGWIMPIAFETFNFDKYDLVISVTSEAAKGIITKPGTTHICYCLTPTRYLWSHHDLYFHNFIARFISKPIVNYLRSWDKIAAQRPDVIVAISTEVKRRIKKYYNRDSIVVYPLIGLQTTAYRLQPKEAVVRSPKAVSYYLIVSRLVLYKRIDLVINVFNKTKKKLIVVGVGSELTRLKRMAYSNIQFLGEVSDEKLVKIYLRAKALIMPQEEDFGLVSLEAQSFGIPVIAFKKGGTIDTVIDGKTGVFFDKQNEEDLLAAIAKFEKISFNYKLPVDNARRFIQRSSFRSYFGWWGGNTPLAKIEREKS